MFAIKNLFKNRTVFAYQKNMSSLSVYDMQEFTVQEPSINKENITNVFHQVTRNLTNSHHNLTPKEVLLMQQECMYFRASPKYGFYKTNKSE